MMRTRITLRTAILSFAVIAVILSLTSSGAHASRGSRGPVGIPSSPATGGSAQNSCGIIIFPAGPVAVAPNQPDVQAQSTVGIINALCEVTLDFIGCGFTPTSITLGCDANGDGVSDLSIPLKNITVVNRVLLQATIPVLTATPGTAFPLACCGGQATITLTRTVGPGDDNVFGGFTQTLTCSIDLGIRAPVVISAVPSEGDCAKGQNLLIPGSCFLLADGKPNVTSVFAVEVGNPNNVIQANPIHTLTPFLIDAFFQPGPASAGKTFLIYASGPNGTSRNLTALPPGAPAGCPLGNEQGVTVTFKCKSTSGSGDTPPRDTPPVAEVQSCRLDRDASGVFSLNIMGRRFREGAAVSVNGLTPRKVKFKDFDQGSNAFTRITAKGKLCANLPGVIVIANPAESASPGFFCSQSCAN